jgi:hypothetical protein
MQRILLKLTPVLLYYVGLRPNLKQPYEKFRPPWKMYCILLP